MLRLDLLSVLSSEPFVFKSIVRPWITFQGRSDGITLPQYFGAFANPRLFVRGLLRIALTLSMYQVSNDYTTGQSL